tara:strand:- start:177 stop:431 length:255 start_codon:yes stop_codon:yes gene_type:complete
LYGLHLSFHFQILIAKLYRGHVTSDAAAYEWPTGRSYHTGDCAAGQSIKLAIFPAIQQAPPVILPPGPISDGRKSATDDTLHRT